MRPKISKWDRASYILAVLRMTTVFFILDSLYLITLGQTVFPETVYENVSISNQADMCVWVNQLNNSQSTVITSDKGANSLFVYNLDGTLVQNISVPGQPGNIDVRYNFSLGGVLIDFIGYNDRSNGTLRFYKVDKQTRMLSFIGSISAGSNYGFCVYKSPISGKYYAFSSSGPNIIRQYELYDKSGLIGGTFIRQINNGTGVVEGMVCDDVNGILFAGNKTFGIYKYNAEPTGNIIVRLDAETGDESGWTVSEINAGNSFEAVTEAKYNGNYGYKILYGPNGGECEKYYISSEKDEAYFRYNYYIPNNWESESGDPQIFMGGIESNQGGNILVGLMFTTSAKKINSFKICSNPLLDVEITNSGYWTPDTWHSIEFRYKRGTSANGGIQCWIDNNLVRDDMDNTITSYANTFSVGPWEDWGGGFGNGKYVYIDDVVASVSPTNNLIAAVGQNGFSADVNGLTLYYLPAGEGYLLASSQGNNRFYVFDSQAPHNYIKYFTVSGVTATQGIDVCNLNLGGLFSQGIFLCHSGGASPFVVRGCQWEDVGLTINTGYWPLPVELVYFTGRVVSDKIILEWKTETEVSNYGFEVEKKINLSWEKIGFVPGNGNSNSPHIYEFTDGSFFVNNYYRLKQIDTDGQFEYFKEIEIISLMNEHKLSDNYPNPFNPSTKIKYQIPEQGFVTLKVYDVLGNEVTILVNDEKVIGSYEIEFDGTNLSSGLYFYRLQTASYVETKKMILMK